MSFLGEVPVALCGKWFFTEPTISNDNNSEIEGLVELFYIKPTLSADKIVQRMFPSSLGKFAAEKVMRILEERVVLGNLDRRHINKTPTLLFQEIAGQEKLGIATCNS